MKKFVQILFFASAILFGTGHLYQMVYSSAYAQGFTDGINKVR